MDEAIRGMNVATDFHVVLRLRISGTIPPLDGKVLN
jgi:hypothetical protein